jgi:hypothetical protein
MFDDRRGSPAVNLLNGVKESAGVDRALAKDAAGVGIQQKRRSHGSSAVQQGLNALALGHRLAVRRGSFVRSNE